MEKRIIDREITLIPYYPNPDVTLSWYQDLDLCKQVDNIDYTYTPELLNRMYTYLSTHGDCYYIQYKGSLSGMLPCATMRKSASWSVKNIRISISAADALLICLPLQKRKA